MPALDLTDHETIHRVPEPKHFFKYLVASDGSFLSYDNQSGYANSTVANDEVIWDQIDSQTVRHVATGHSLRVSRVNGEGSVALHLEEFEKSQAVEALPAAVYEITHGPAEMPSAYLETFKRQGWVCLTQVIDDATLEELEKTAGTDRYADRKADWSRPALAQNAAVAKTAAEPLSLWLIRQYMQIDDIRLSHTPAFAVLGQDDGKRNVQGWHSDFPYHWGVPAKGVVPTPTGKTSLGVQRNVCVSPFTRDGGATVFKLGSHARDEPPPKEWGDATSHAKPGYRAANGLPYGGPEADVVEAPGGSIILYDSRTWHRAGVNRTPKRRAAMLQAMTPMYIFPKNDTSASYKLFLESPVCQEINSRERQEIQNLMVHQFIGPGGQYAITADQALTDTLNSHSSTGY